MDAPPPPLQRAVRPGAGAPVSPGGSHVVRRPVRPRPVSGRWRTVKDRVMIVILLAFFLGPHLPWPRPEGQPQRALLFDFLGGHAYVLWFRFGYADLLLLMGTLLVAALALFLTNTLVGRVWCGFACPQTLWTDGFRKLDRALRPRIGAGGVRIVWVAISVLTALTILAWFAPASTLWPAIFRGEAAAFTYALLLAFTLATYFLATLVQDMVCTHFCPWPRFQAVMVDRDTKIVTYEAWRGEPRGPAKRAGSGGRSGDCVDCGLCVKVCPMGIDIREGSQLACIGCGLCVDACAPVMARLGRPSGLIRFSSDREQERAATGTAPPAPRLRARTLGYGAVMLLVIAVIVPVQLGRTGVLVQVVPDRSGGHVTLADGSIRNIYQLAVQDGRPTPGALTVTVEGLPGARVEVLKPGGEAGLGNRVPAATGPTGHEQLRLLVSVPPGTVQGPTPVRFRFRTAEGETVAVEDGQFRAPGAGQ